MAIPIDVVVFKCSKICPTGNRRNRALFISQKISAASQTVTTARIAPKIRQGQPPNIWLTWFQISSKSVLFGGVMAERANAVLLPREYFHDSPEAKHHFRRIINELALMYDVTRTHDS